jgi:hypothetical protein
MNAELINFAARLGRVSSKQDDAFNGLALELFGLQFKYNPAYRRICEAKASTPRNVRHWTQAPFLPTAAFKELELSCLSAEERTAVFHSSGTTEQKPSRHFHCVDSLKLYETALWAGFAANVLGLELENAGTQVSPPTNDMGSCDLPICPSPLRFDATAPKPVAKAGKSAIQQVWKPALQKSYDLVVLTPAPRLAPHSSLVHMFETVSRQLAAPESVFVGEIDGDGAWAIDFNATLAALRTGDKPKLILGTAFSFVHLLDFLAEHELCLQLPVGSRVMETGGYKNRSRTIPRGELHSLITDLLNIPREDIIC